MSLSEIGQESGQRVDRWWYSEMLIEYLDHTEHMFIKPKRRKFHSITTEDGNASKSAATSNTKKC